MFKTVTALLSILVFRLGLTYLLTVDQLDQLVLKEA
jgi:hypothetical protein